MPDRQNRARHRASVQDTTWFQRWPSSRREFDSFVRNEQKSDGRDWRCAKERKDSVIVGTLDVCRKVEQGWARLEKGASSVLVKDSPWGDQGLGFSSLAAADQFCRRLTGLVPDGVYEDRKGL